MSVNMREAIPDGKRKDARFGKHFWNIDFESNMDLRISDFQFDPKNPKPSPIVGTLQISHLNVPVTIKEIDRLIETLSEAKHQIDMAYKLNLYKQ